jgi:hypothetical protein
MLQRRGYSNSILIKVILLLAIHQCVSALPQAVRTHQSSTPKTRIFHEPMSDSILYVSKVVGVSPIALCTGTASFISGFDVGIIAGALLLLAPEFGLSKTPHRCDTYLCAILYLSVTST